MESSQVKKLMFIDKILKDLEKNNKQITTDEDTFMKWYEIDKFSLKLLKNYISNELIKYSKDALLSNDINKKKKEIDVNIKKMNILHFYLNACITTFLIKYLDMIERVKFATFFSLSSILLFYYSNYYFSRYKLYHNYTTYCRLTSQKRNQLLTKIKNDYFHKNKEDNFIKQNLARYWKEPMAWH